MDAKQKALEVVAKISGLEAAKLEPKLDLVADLGIEISDEDAAKMDTVGDILDYLGGPAPA